MTKRLPAGRDDLDRQILSAVLCVLIWILIFLASFFVPLRSVQSEERYISIAVTLSSDSPQVEATIPLPLEDELVPAQSQAITPSPAQAVTSTEAPKRATMPEPAPSSSGTATPATPPATTQSPVPIAPPTVASKPAKAPVTPIAPTEIPQEQVLAPDLSQIPIGSIDPTAPVQTQKPAIPVTPLNPVKPTVPVQTFEGVIAKTDETKTSGNVTTGSSSSSKEPTQNTSVSEGTTSAVQNINRSVTLVQSTSTDGVSASITATVSGGGNETAAFRTDDGKQYLISPKDPKITLSAESEKLIEVSVTVTIRFTVMQSGSVPGLFIQFLPASLLPVPVQSEIREQISKWRFSEGKEGNSSATFVYTITVK